MDDFLQLVNASASSGNFTLLGGLYGVSVMAETWNSDSITLNALGQDGSTLIPVLPAFTKNGIATIDLLPGVYQLTFATATGVYATVARITGRE